MGKKLKYINLPYNPALANRAQELRKAGNLAEVLMWRQLKNKALRGLDFDRQKIIGNYIVDFFCPECGVVIEIDGVTHDNKIEYDNIRNEYLEGLGLFVIHVLVEDMFKNLQGVIDMLDNHPALQV